MSAILWMTQHIENLQPPKQKIRFNPRPPKTVQAGSTTDAVLSIMHSRPNSVLTEGELIWLTQRSHSAVSHALRILMQWKLISAYEDPRNARYLRYKLAQQQHY